jgi:FXSXX-COOH protein
VTTTTAAETGVVTNIPALHDLSLEDVLTLDGSVLAESLRRVREHLSRDESEHISRFTAAL